LTLLRDPFVLALYTYCVVNSFIRLRGLAQLWIGFAILTVLLGLGQYLINGYGLVGWMLGVRTYWLYMPLAFVVAETFRMEDVRKFILLNLLISIPYALLVSVQYSAPPSAFVNLGVGEDEGGAVGLKDNIIRPFGLFTYTGPNVQYTAALVALFMAFYIDRTSSRWRVLLLALSGVAVASMAVLTGSRSIYFMIAAIMLVTIAGLSTSRAALKAFSRILGVLGFAVLAGLLLVNVFPDMLDAMAKRLEAAERSEGSIWDRAIGGLFAWVEPLFTAPIFGEGIGLGAPGVASLLGVPPLSFGESDLQRNVNELGLLFGIAMLALRFATAASVLFIAFRLVRKGREMALPLVGYYVLPFALGQVTHSPVNAFLPWLFLGLVLALHRDTPRRGYHARA